MSPSALSPTAYKDLFSKQSSDYAKFRPRYPAELFDQLASLAPAHGQVWDAGTGNGQAAVELARRFESVLATDPSQKQLDSAEPTPRLTYGLGPAHACPLADASCDLVTAAQAFHWFDQPGFMREAARVLKPRGVVALWCYNLCEVTPDIDVLVRELYDDILGPYWEPERRQIEQGYGQARFSDGVEEIAFPRFTMRREWTVEHLIGYLGTWSSLQTYLAKNGGKNPLEEMASRLKQAWGTGEREARWTLLARVGRKSERRGL